MKASEVVVVFIGIREWETGERPIATWSSSAVSSLQGQFREDLVSGSMGTLESSTAAPTIEAFKAGLKHAVVPLVQNMVDGCAPPQVLCVCARVPVCACACVCMYACYRS